MRSTLVILVLLMAAPLHAQTETEAEPEAESVAKTETETGTDTTTEPDTATEPDAAPKPDTATQPEADTATDSGTDTADGTGTGAADTITAPPRPPPKVAVVVAGDPDETLRNTAAFVEQELVHAGVEVPSDPALRAALRGEAPTEEDGLEKLRAIRRGLGLDPRKDLSSYQRIGLIAGADALVVVRREGLIRIEVFDVAAAQFYEGILDFDTSDSAERVKFVLSRAEQAQLRWSAPPAPPPEQKVAINPEEEKNDDSRAKKRWKKVWPYVLVGALLAGGVTYLIIDSRRAPEEGVPLLRFTPGEE